MGQTVSFEVVKRTDIGFRDPLNGIELVEAGAVNIRVASNVEDELVGGGENDKTMEGVARIALLVAITLVPRGASEDNDRRNGGGPG